MSSLQNLFTRAGFSKTLFTKTPADTAAATATAAAAATTATGL